MVGGGGKLPDLMDLTGVAVWADTTAFTPKAVGAKRIRTRTITGQNRLDFASAKLDAETGITLIKKFPKQKVNDKSFSDAEFIQFGL